MKSDDGFVLIDALVASAIVSLVGIAAFSLATAYLQRSDRLLERSQLLVNLESKSYEVLVTGHANLSRLPASDDGTWTYQATTTLPRQDAELGGFKPWRVEVFDRTGGRQPEHLDLLVSKKGLTQ